MHRPGLVLDPVEASAVRTARERFAAGDDVLTGVRPQIALSWLRCRDSYQVDPDLALAPPAGDVRVACLDRDVLLTELGGLAASMQSRLPGAVVTVVDADGKVVGAWGDGVPHAEEAGLGLRYSWSEQASGTNGMGTALQAQGLTVVLGPEHWCQGFHGLDCLGTAIVDPVTSRPLAALDVSTATGAMPDVAPELLRSAAQRVHSRLELRAQQRAVELAEAFETMGAHSARPAMAVDAGGRLVVANDAATRLLDLPRRGVAVETRLRPDLADPGFSGLVADAAAAAHSTPHWQGWARLAHPRCDEPLDVTLRAVLSGGHPIGFVVAIGSQEGVVPMPPAPRDVGGGLSRVVAHVGSRTLLLRPAEIHYARSDGNTIWLSTDRGLLRAAERGLGKLAASLERAGFLRVHRTFVVNLSRVREVGRGLGGELELYLDTGGTQRVPVSRSHAREVRSRLGL